MSYYDYIESQKIHVKQYPFYALVMELMRQADDFNLNFLKSCWPNVWQELKERYNAPGGILPNEKKKRKNEEGGN